MYLFWHNNMSCQLCHCVKLTFLEIEVLELWLVRIDRCTVAMKAMNANMTAIVKPEMLKAETKPFVFFVRCKNLIRIGSDWSK